MKKFNQIQKGQELEQFLSLEFHKQSLPLLIDPKVLRKRGAGQVDLARICFKQKQKIIELLEVKSGMYVSNHQRLRLHSSATLIGEVFQTPVRVVYSLRSNR